MNNAIGKILAGDCLAWRLPADATGAGFARSAVWSVFAGLGIAGELAYDVAVGASELATNVHQHVGDGGAAAPEMWVYLRWGPRPEVVLKVYDSAHWRGPLTYGSLRPPMEAEGGRGFEVVDALAAEHGGSWGMHRTRSRLWVPSVAGKAVFMAVPVPEGCLTDRTRVMSLSPRQVAEEVRAMLAARGLGRLQWSAGHGMAVICVRAGVHVWVREDSISYCVPGSGTVRHALADSVEAVEQVVRHCADLDARRVGLDGGL